MSKGSGLALPKENYMYIIAGVVVVLIGFFMMSGGGADDPTVFEKDELFSARRITVAPFLVMLGYVAVLYGILKRPKTTTSIASEKDAKKDSDIA